MMELKPTNSGSRSVTNGRELRPDPALKVPSIRHFQGLCAVVLGLVIMGALSACDLETTNPGPIHDVNVDDPAAHSAIVNGAMRATLQGLAGYAYWGGAVVRDHHPGGHTGTAGVPEGIELGRLDDNQTATGGWNSSHQGRWIGEHMIARLRDKMGSDADSYPPMARFHLWAGFASRILGENACTAVFENSAPEHHTAYFTRAVQHFSDAARVASAVGDNETRLAALAARASAHLHLGNWAEAAADASQIPEDFAFRAQYFDENRYSYAQPAGITFRGLTFWHHPFEDYFPETGDPRAAWGMDPNVNFTVSRAAWGRIIPMYYPLKWIAPRGPSERTVFAPVLAQQSLIPVDLATGREALLIRAEVRLVEGDLEGGMALLNQVRTTTVDPGTGAFGNYFTGEPLEPVVASNMEEAWAALKFERLLEFNMEGRRFGDRKRWALRGTPGELHPLEYLPDNHVERFGVPREVRLCFPMSRGEKDANERIPDGFQEIEITDARVVPGTVGPLGPG